MAVVCFISLIHEVGGAKKTVLAAAFVVLLYPGINEYRSFIGRDAGYIAFYLLSLLLLFKYANSPRFGYAIGWAISIFAAALFRIEGFLFLLILPLLYQWRRVTTLSARLMLIITMIGACLVSGLIMVWWSFPITLGLGADNILHALTLSYQSLWQYISTHVSAKTLVIGEQFLTEYSREHAFAVYIAAIGAILLVEIFAILNLAILGAFVVVKLFLTGRFPLALSLTLMLAVPFSLVALYEKWQEKRARPIGKNWVFPMVAILMLLMGVNGLYSPTGKTYLKDAGVWLKENTPTESSLFGNNLIVMYYSSRKLSRYEAVYEWQRTRDFISSGRWLNYDYLAFRIKHEDGKRSALLAQMLGKDSIKTFRNKKGDQVVVFKVR
jgi:hypothetical protein